MFLERYEYRYQGSYRQYEFYSEGPKGIIRKVVNYKFYGKVNGYSYYNLGFGDYDPKTKRISDLIVSDNKDLDKLLATVAATALDFTNRVQKSKILVFGSTPARTRLYQMKISAHWETISSVFDIQGEIEKGVWKPFKKGENYFAFQAQKKRSKFTQS